MQTFLPYADFARSAACLDRQRLGKQRVECFQLLNALNSIDPKVGWINHPAAKMWRGHAQGLTWYMAACIGEWVRRGYKNTMVVPTIVSDKALPPWLGDEAFHAAHRAALLFKNPGHYSQFGWTEEPKLEYIWPTP
jgi:hypothetical protein